MSRMFGAGGPGGWTLTGRPGLVLNAVLCFAAPFISRGVTILLARQRGEEPPPGVRPLLMVVWVIFVGAGLYNLGRLINLFH